MLPLLLFLLHLPFPGHILRPLRLLRLPPVSTPKSSIGISDLHTLLYLILSGEAVLNSVRGVWDMFSLLLWSFHLDSPGQIAPPKAQFLAWQQLWLKDCQMQD